MRVGVTGADGFTGRYLCAALEAAGHDVAVLSADVTDSAAVADAVAEAKPDSIIHLAALAFVHSEDFSGFYQVNQIGAFNLLAAALRFAPNARVVLASSATVYGDAAEGFLNEDTPLNPRTHYAVSKCAMEMGAAFWRDRLDVRIVRPFNYTGVGQESRYLIPKIVSHFRDRAPVIELGNLSVKRDFGDVRSVVDAYVSLATIDPAQDVFNICTGASHSVGDIIALASELTGHSLEVTVNPAFVRPNEVAVLAGDPQRLRDALPDWRPRSLRDTLSWMLNA